MRKLLIIALLFAAISAKAQRGNYTLEQRALYRANRFRSDSTDTLRKNQFNRHWRSSDSVLRNTRHYFYIDTAGGKRQRKEWFPDDNTPRSLPRVPVNRQFVKP